MYKFLFIFQIFTFVNSFSQGAYLPLGSESYHLIDRLDIKRGNEIIHTNMKPYDRAKMVEFARDKDTGARICLLTSDMMRNDFIYKDNTEWLDTNSLYLYKNKPLLKFFYKEKASFISVNYKDFTVRLNPIIQVGGGNKVENGKYTFYNRRGFEMRATIKKHFTFYTMVTDNQERYMDYVTQKATNHFGQNSYANSPGNTYYKEFYGDGYDYFQVRGYVKFDFLKYFDVQLGHDKNFIGNGVRSLMLSDNAAPYFFLKLNTKIWKINYQNIFAELTHQYPRGADQLLPKKYGAFHHFNFAVNNKLQIGLYESVIMSRNKGFELQYLNPIIFYRAIEQSIGSPDNAFVGADFKWNFLHRGQLYGQFIVDEFNFTHIRNNDGWWGNKMGFQIGGKYIDAFNMNGLDLQAEVNLVMPYTYTHRSPAISDSAANFSHYNQELAHPLGANFVEGILIARYQPRTKLFLQAKLYYMLRGADSTGQSWGSDVFYPASANTIPREMDNTLLQGYRTNVILGEARVSYMPWHNIFLDATATYRKSKSELGSLNTNEIYFNLGLRMNLAMRDNHF
jgi:hypothetical protein